MESLDTARLRIRPFRESDVDAVTRLLDGCFGRAPAAARRAWLDWSVRNYDALARLGQPPYGDYAITLRAPDGAVVGSVGLVPSFGPFGKLPAFRSGSDVQSGGLFRPEMGLFWAVDPDHRRKGYATEAAAALASFAFDRLRVERLVATTERGNPASVAVMRKLGMAVETNPDPEPQWFQVVGVLFNPALRRPS